MNKLEAAEIARLDEMLTGTNYNPAACSVVWGCAELIEDLQHKPGYYNETFHLQRTLFSVGSNYAEGHAKGSLKEILKFLNISVGSLIEAQAQYIMCGLTVPEGLTNMLEFIRSEQYHLVNERKNQIIAQVSRKSVDK